MPHETYEWSYIYKWLIYPILYTPFALLNGILELDRDYVYGFLDIDTNGWSAVIIMIIAIFVLFTLISVFYIYLNRKYNKQI